jgi:hypothetical protein
MMKKYSLIAMELGTTLLAGALVAMPMVDQADAAKKNTVKNKIRITQSNNDNCILCSNSASGSISSNNNQR